MPKKPKIKPHLVNRFIITIENTEDGENCTVRVQADPPIPEECEEVEIAPNVVMTEFIMDYLNEEFGSDDWAAANETSMKVH